MIRVAMTWAAATALAAAAAAQAPGWTATASPDGQVTAATPCSAAELAALRRAPAAATGVVALEPAARILCRWGKTAFVAGVKREPRVPAGQTFFDLIATQTRADSTAEGRPTLTRLAGRRALTNRQAANGGLAQTGFIEVDRTTLVLFVVGIEPGSGLDTGQQAAMVDRFVNSIRIGGR